MTTSVSFSVSIAYQEKLDPDPDPEPHQSQKVDPNPHQSEKQDSNMHHSEKLEAMRVILEHWSLEGPNLEKKVSGRIRIRIKLKCRKLEVGSLGGSFWSIGVWKVQISKKN
jgi:hypothetical protein